MIRRAQNCNCEQSQYLRAGLKLILRAVRHDTPRYHVLVRELVKRILASDLAHEPAQAKEVGL